MHAASAVPKYRQHLCQLILLREMPQHCHMARLAAMMLNHSRQPSAAATAAHLGGRVLHLQQLEDSGAVIGDGNIADVVH